MTFPDLLCDISCTGWKRSTNWPF